MSWIIKKLEGTDTLRWRTWICMLLVTLMLVTSLGTVYKIEVEVPAAMESGIAAVVSVLNEPEISGGQAVDFVMPDTLDVNVLLFLKFASKTDEVIEIYESMMALAESVGDSSIDYNSAYRQFKSVAVDAIDLVTSSEFENAVALAATLVSAYGTGANKGMVITLMTAMAFILPSLLLAALLGALGDLIKSKNAPEKRYLAAAKALRKAIAAYMFVLAVSMISTDIHLSPLLLAGLVLCLVGTLVGVMFSRATRYTECGRAYMSLLQRMSAIELCGFAVFYIFAAMSDVIGKVLSASLADFLAYAATQRRGEEFLDIFVSVFVGVAIIACLVAVFEGVSCSAARLGGFMSRDRESALVSAIMGVVMIVLVLYSWLSDARVELSLMDIMFLLLSALGLAIIAVCEIMIPRLRRKVCKGLHESEKFAVLVGLEAIEMEDD